MSMHLHHPSLSLAGKKKGKHKYRNAAEAQRARQLAEDWAELKKRHGVPAKEKRVVKVFEPFSTAPRPYIRDTGPRPPSLNPTNMQVAPKPDTKIYTGSKMIGIGTMHKSNSVPIFSNEEAMDQARMRRG